jgi:hypothetical protein
MLGTLVRRGGGRLIPERDAYVLRGPTHRYRLGTELGRRVFYAEDETGQHWAVKIAAREQLELRRRLGEQLPKGRLPLVRELVELGGGRLGFLVMEMVPGVRLHDLLLEGRYLQADEARQLARAVVEHAEACAETKWRVRSLAAQDVVYDTHQREWRVVVTGELAQDLPDTAEATWIGSLVWQAAGGDEVRDPPLGSGEERFVETLAAARFGRLTLTELRQRLDRRRLWRTLRSQP